MKRQLNISRKCASIVLPSGQRCAEPPTRLISFDADPSKGHSYCAEHADLVVRAFSAFDHGVSRRVAAA